MPKNESGASTASLIDACKRNHNRLVLTPESIPHFKALIRLKGGRHALRDVPQGDGSLKNQVIVTAQPGTFLVFEIYTGQPLHA